MSQRTALILGLLLLIVPASISDAWVLSAQTKCTGHCWSGTYACGYRKKCCSKCQGKCGW